MTDYSSSSDYDYSVWDNEQPAYTEKTFRTPPQPKSIKRLPVSTSSVQSNEPVKLTDKNIIEILTFLQNNTHTLDINIHYIELHDTGNEGKRRYYPRVTYRFTNGNSFPEWRELVRKFTLDEPERNSSEYAYVFLPRNFLKKIERLSLLPMGAKQLHPQLRNPDVYSIFTKLTTAFDAGDRMAKQAHTKWLKEKHDASEASRTPRGETPRGQTPRRETPRRLRAPESELLSTTSLDMPYRSGSSSHLPKATSATPARPYRSTFSETSPISSRPKQAIAKDDRKTSSKLTLTGELTDAERAIFKELISVSSGTSTKVPPKPLKSSTPHTRYKLVMVKH